MKTCTNTHTHTLPHTLPMFLFIQEVYFSLSLGNTRVNLESPNQYYRIIKVLDMVKKLAVSFNILT